MNLPAATISSAREIADFAAKLRQASKGPRGRLIFALDATASREPSWEQARTIQGEMFREAAALGGLEMRVCYFRGIAEFRTTPWLSDSSEMVRRMNMVQCIGGQTQIGRVLAHAIAEARIQKIGALIYVGDALEEPIDHLCIQAGEIALLNLPIFIFHEGGDPVAARGFRQLTHITGGAYMAFDQASAAQLRDLLCAVAAFAVGGLAALNDYAKKTGTSILALADQLERRR